MKNIVRKGYNKIAETYSENRAKFKTNPILMKFIGFLPKKAHVLDIGCGTGVPTAKKLAEKGFKVTGIDISEKMLELARKNVPDAKFFKKDMISMNFREKFDGITAMYSVFHVPKKNHKKLFKCFFKHG